MRLPPLAREALIRTLGVSLVAVVAIVASLAVVRQRQEEPVRVRERRGAEPSPAAVDLDLLRKAGL
jgi:hypothetical protein